ncbi:peptide MFS transporter [Alterisphingorhabdus coralli]|uniref:Peptide MFS transporter n=1 Tax=Alterisphingorhabdus coralli TaxID=3071408 RepID=A0AA97FAY8_9SPHN|nr:peptide MFS transporter [Parasphingorhabdus sp. SCSIO 66989]WOE76522.1 peptide MFS transporter [Parasphingorhabdus sp. SCSIO 66989]
MAGTYEQDGDAAGTFLGHPKGLFILFFVEMWERFSYYGMRGLLIFYLTKHFLFDREFALGILGAYVTLVYITPIIGGALADRYMGARRAVLLGGILLVIGHAGMAIEGSPVQQGEQADPLILNIFYLSLAFIIAGVGFLKANISTMVGFLYPKTDGRRDSAFTIFYMGINLGAFLGSLLCGFLGETFGWAYGFGAAGVGMLLGLVVFVLGRPQLRGAGEAPDEVKLTSPAFMGLSPQILIYLGTALMILIAWQLVRYQDTVNILLAITGGVALTFIIAKSVIQLDPHERDRIFAAILLILFQIMFWALFEQASSSLNLFTDEHVNRDLFGWEVPASMFQSLNAGFIILFAPVLAALWVRLSNKGRDPSAGMKFGLGLVQLGLGYVVLAWGAELDNGLVPMIFIVLIYLLHTTGELCLSPVGLSAMTRLSVPSMVGLMMGTWFLGSAGGNALSAIIAQEAAADGAKGGYVSAYWDMGYYAVGFGLFVMVISPLITKLMHLDTLKDDNVGDDLVGQRGVGEPQAGGMHPETRLAE